MRLIDCGGMETLSGKEGFELSLISHLCGCSQNLSVMLAALTGEKRQQREYAGICCSQEGQRRQGIRSPTQAAQDVTGVAANGSEGIFQGLATDRVVDNV